MKSFPQLKKKITQEVKKEEENEKAPRFHIGWRRVVESFGL